MADYKGNPDYVQDPTDSTTDTEKVNNVLVILRNARSLGNMIPKDEHMMVSLAFLMATTLGEIEKIVGFEPTPAAEDNVPFMPGS